MDVCSVRRTLCIFIAIRSCRWRWRDFLPVPPSLLTALSPSKTSDSYMSTNIEILHTLHSLAHVFWESVAWRSGGINNASVTVEDGDKVQKSRRG